MEFWPVKIDWEAFTKTYKSGNDDPWLLELQSDEASDVGSLNSALADLLPLMSPYLSEDVKQAVAPLVTSICACEIDGWPRHSDEPDDYWIDVQHDSIGVIYAPSTVQRVAALFDSVPRDRLTAEIEHAWTKMSKDPSDYSLSEPNYFDDAAEFVEYLEGWHKAFDEAAREGRALGIAGG